MILKQHIKTHKKYCSHINFYLKTHKNITHLTSTAVNYRSTSFVFFVLER